MNTNSEFGRKLATLRKLAGYNTQRDLARDSGVALATISTLESGLHKKPTYETMARLMPCLDTSKKLKCPTCGSLNNVRVVGRYERPNKPSHWVCYCHKCGTEYKPYEKLNTV